MADSVSLLQATRPASRLIWAVTGALGVAQVISYHVTGLSLDLADGGWPFLVIPACLALTLVYRFARPDPWIAFGTETTAQIMIIMLLATLLTYPVAAADFPYRDTTFYAADRALGFNWRAYLGLVNDHPWVGHVFNAAYYSMKVQFAIVISALVATSRFLRLQHYALVLAVALIAALPIFMLMPAVAYYAHLGITPVDFANITPSVPYAHIAHLEGMRTGATHLIRLDHLEGMITFPSFHTTAAITFCWAIWPLRRLRPWMVAMNALLLASTPIDGGHYLTDLIGGAAMALFAILVAGWILARVGHAATSRHLPRAPPLQEST
jgi:hypothetical protein